MDWRALLRYDLRQWLPGYRALPPPPTDRPAESFDGYPKSVRDKIRDPMWKGPICTGPEDMLFVLEQIRLCTRAGLPLHQGLDAAARNEVETLRMGGPGNRIRTSLGLLLAVVAGGAIVLALAFAPMIVTAVLPLAFAAGGTAGMGIAHVALTRSRRAALCGSLVHAMNRGLTLSEAMARLSAFFPRPVVSLVAVGESTNRLAETVEQLNGDALRRYLRGRQLQGWLAYVGGLITVQVAILTLLLYKVVPVMLEIREELRVTSAPGHNAPVRDIPFPLPLPSLDTLGNTPHWVLANLIPFGLLALAVLAGLAWRGLARGRYAGRWSGSSLELYLPVYRRLLALQNLGAAAGMLSQLLRAGVPLDRALATAVDSGLHPAYAAWFEEVREQVRGGASFGDACILTRAGGLVPPSFHDAVAMGENLGRLEDGLAYIDERYAGIVERHIQWWMNGAQVASILLMGYVVLSINAGVFGMLLDIVDHLIQ